MLKEMSSYSVITLFALFICSFIFQRINWIASEVEWNFYQDKMIIYRDKRVCSEKKQGESGQKFIMMTLRNSSTGWNRNDFLLHVNSMPFFMITIVAQLSRQKSKIFIMNWYGGQVTRNMERTVEHSPDPIYAKLHMASTLPDSSIQPVFGNQVQNGVAQSCRCGYTVW